jgi:hypothetical protein
MHEGSEQVLIAFLSPEGVDARITGTLFAALSSVVVGHLVADELAALPSSRSGRLSSGGTFWAGPAARCPVPCTRCGSDRCWGRSSRRSRSTWGRPAWSRSRTCQWCPAGANGTPAPGSAPSLATPSWGRRGHRGRIHLLNDGVQFVPVL